MCVARLPVPTLFAHWRDRQNSIDSLPIVPSSVLVVPSIVDRTTRRGDCRGDGEGGRRILVQQDRVE